MGDKKALVPAEIIVRKILFLRGEKVLLDRDLADLYGIKTKVLKQAVRRNIKRFPEDFMFELTKEEFENWRSQFVILNDGSGIGGRNLRPVEKRGAPWETRKHSCRLK